MRLVCKRSVFPFLVQYNLLHSLSDKLHNQVCQLIGTARERDPLCIGDLVIPLDMCVHVCKCGWTYSREGGDGAKQAISVEQVAAAAAECVHQNGDNSAISI